MIYFTGDQHFGHANIIKHCNRPFSSVDEMDKSLLEKWNNRVKKNDTVYILGDLFFRNAVPCEEYLQSMNGKKHLIVGNHDKGWMKKVDMNQYFETVASMVEIGDGARKLVLCHYPMMTWEGVAKGTYMIHAHIHNNTNADYFPLLQKMPNILNAGVEINNYEPVTFETLVKNNQAFKENV